MFTVRKGSSVFSYSAYSVYWLKSVLTKGILTPAISQHSHLKVGPPEQKVSIGVGRVCLGDCTTWFPAAITSIRVCLVSTCTS